jgi:hypothetical protein
VLPRANSTRCSTTTFQQATRVKRHPDALPLLDMGSGTILTCDAPELLRVSLGGGADEIEVRLSPGPDEGTATLELQHATTLDEHEIGGEMYDAIFCMGGGYYPRLEALDQHLRGTLPDDYDSAAFHLNAEMRATIARGSAAMAALLEADAKR